MAREILKLSDGNLYDFILLERESSNVLKIHLEDDIDKFKENLDLFSKIDILTKGYEVIVSYFGYTTIWKDDDNYLYLSNDESVYVEPEPIVIQEYIPTLEEVKANKISELSSICNKLIEDGVDVQLSSGEVEHFSYKPEDQTNIKDAWELSVQTGMDVPYHCDGGPCRLYNTADITSIYVTAKTNLTHHTTYFNQLKMYIMSLDDIELVSDIQYGIELAGEYLENYNNIMAQTSLIIATVIGIDISEAEEDNTELDNNEDIEINN